MDSEPNVTPPIKWWDWILHNAKEFKDNGDKPYGLGTGDVGLPGAKLSLVAENGAVHIPLVPRMDNDEIIIQHFQIHK